MGLVMLLLLAPIVTILSFVLSLPTAYALGRYSFRGKEALRTLILLPIVMPQMVIAMFLSRVFFGLGLSQTFLGLVLGHTLLSMPYMLRILATAFEAIPQDLRPRKDQPFYHLLAENMESSYVAYVSQGNLMLDDSEEPIDHPAISGLFTDYRDGRYTLRREHRH